MRFSPLKHFYPTAEALLAADRDELAENILRHLKTYEGGGTVHQAVGGFNRGYYVGVMEGRPLGLGPLPTEPEYGSRQQPEVSNRVQEAWDWLGSKGYIRQNSNQPHSSWFVITSEGERVLSGQSAQKRASTNGHPSFIAASRIQQLRELSTPDFDFQKLVQLCEELNACYAGNCFLAVAMLTRALLDHVPPIFDQPSFAQVASNYGEKSFKDAMQHLQNGARKVADQHLHGPIRKRETLPTSQQVHFGPMLDVLFAEIIRLKQ